MGPVSLPLKRSDILCNVYPHCTGAPAKLGPWEPPPIAGEWNFTGEKKQLLLGH